MSNHSLAPPSKSSAAAEKKYEPTPEQQARAEALKRYNRTYVYGPLIGLGLVLTLFLAAMLLVSFAGPDISGWRTLISAVADMIVITMTVTVTASCALIPATAVAIVSYGRQNEHRPLATLQTWLWRLDGRVSAVQNKVNGWVPRIIDPITTINGWFAAVVTFSRRLGALLIPKNDFQGEEHSNEQ